MIDWIHWFYNHRKHSITWILLITAYWSITARLITEVYYGRVYYVKGDEKKCPVVLENRILGRESINEVQEKVSFLSFMLIRWKLLTDCKDQEK